MATMDQGIGAEVASSPAAVERKKALERVPTDNGLPKYWHNGEGLVATLHSCLHGKATFVPYHRGGGRKSREAIVVSTFELYRTWFPDLGAPIPPNAMPSICTRAHP